MRKVLRSRILGVVLGLEFCCSGDVEDRLKRVLKRIFRDCLAWRRVELGLLELALS